MGVDEKSGERRKRWMISIRTTAETRQRLQDAADLSGRSLTQELESRIEGSFHRDDEVLGPATATLLKLIGTSIRAQEVLSGEPWDNDEQSRAAMIEAVLGELETWTGPAAAWRKLAPNSRKKRTIKIWPREQPDGSEV